MQSVSRYVLGRIARCPAGALSACHAKAGFAVLSHAAGSGAHRSSSILIRSLSHSQRVLRKLEQQETHVTTTQYGINKPEQTVKAEKRKKSARTSAGKDSLRRVAVEAERSRAGLFIRRGRRRFVDPDVETKTITAYCAAERYNISSVADTLKDDGYDIDPYQTGLYPGVVHVQTPNYPPDSSVNSEEKLEGYGDIFVFPSGTVVAWNVPERAALRLVNSVLLPAAESPHPELMETEDLDYIEDSTRESSSIVGETLILGTKVEARASEAPNYPTTYRHSSESLHDTPTPSTSEDGVAQHPQADTILAKIAYSSGLARSAKLAVLENLLEAYQESTREIPTLLSRKAGWRFGGPYGRFNRAFILEKTGELLNIRASLNLYFELTDELPDIFWDSRVELGLEDYYDAVGRAFNVSGRIKALNDKMDYAQEIAGVLRERLNERHGTRLEWLIIALIAIEVVFGFKDQWEEYRARNDPNSTEALLRRYLQAAEAERASKSDSQTRQQLDGRTFM